jgi:hypothetical protein
MNSKRAATKSKPGATKSKGNGNKSKGNGNKIQIAFLTAKRALPMP